MGYCCGSRKWRKESIRGILRCWWYSCSISWTCVLVTWVWSIFFLHFFYVFIYFWDREKVPGGEGQRERETGTKESSALTERAWCGARTHQLWDHDLSQSWMLSQASHPGALDVLNFWKITKLYIRVIHVFFWMYVTINFFKKWNQEISTIEWFYLNYLMTSAICICCVQSHRGSLSSGRKKQTKQGYLNKWHLQISMVQNSLVLPGWLTVWAHLKLVTWFINTRPCRSTTRRKNADNGLLVLIRQMVFAVDEDEDDEDKFAAVFGLK